MKLKRYLLDHILEILVFMVTLILMVLLLLPFSIPLYLIIMIIFLWILFFLIIFLGTYFKKAHFYRELEQNIQKLDQKYLVLEMVSTPTFYEGELFYEMLYEINKSMMENVKNYECSMQDFKEYIELWIHEVKLPISSLVLMCHNHKEYMNKSFIKQVKRLDQYMDQVLYYVRSENAEEDYLIKEVALHDIIQKVALKNKDDLLEKKIDFIVDIEDIYVLTDAKWLEFILNQIINNSIKYQKEENAYIEIKAKDEKDYIILTIKDNGIGIHKNDLPKVFQKTFTGENGRGEANSTGMGLYIVQKLCKKLGHKIEIQSVFGKYTCVQLTFAKHHFYKMDEEK